MAVTRVKERAFWRAVVCQGRSTVAAAQAAQVSAQVGRRWFREAGGMSPVSLAAPTGRYLSLAEREEIAIGLAERLSQRQVAARLGRRHASVVSREVARYRAAHPGRPYRAVAAQHDAETRARRPKPRKLEHEQ